LDKVRMHGVKFMNSSKEILNLIDEAQAGKLQIHRTVGNQFDSELVLVKASELKPVAINWIWHEWLAVGKLHLLGGVAGTGKTTISLSIASTITNGGKFPDGKRAEVGDIVIWTGEDDPQDTLTPRLIAMNANLDRVHFIKGFKEGEKISPFNPAKDMNHLQLAIEKLENVKLLIIDPIVSVVSGDSHKNAEVRNDLAPIINMAEALRFGILGITHVSKNSSGKEPVERITGSLAFAAVARVVMFASKSKNEEDQDIRIFLRGKSNIGSDKGGFEYSLDKTSIMDGIETSRVSWGTSIEGSAYELLAEAETEEEGGGVKGCIKFLSELLSKGEIKSSEALIEIKEAGFSAATFRRAKSKMGVKVQKRGIGSQSYWVINLPKELKDSQRGSGSDVSILGDFEHLSNSQALVKGII